MRRHCAWSLCAVFIFAGCDDGGGGGADPDATMVTPDGGDPLPDMASPPDPDTGMPPPTPDMGPPPNPDMGPPPNPDMGPPPIVPIAPTRVQMVASEGFSDPMDAVASPDGTMFYFTAHGPAILEKGDEPDPIATREQTAGVFAVSAAGGPVERMADGNQLENPTGLLMNCDGSTVYVADLGFASGEDDPGRAAVYRMDMGGPLIELEVGGIGEAAALAFNEDCSQLYVTGYTPDGMPALFTVSPAGGQATVVKAGDPLTSPSGVFVDVDDIAWVMDHLPGSTEGGALFAIEPDGTTREVVAGLRVSEPAGVSLVAGGEIAVIPSRSEAGTGQLITVNTRTGDRTVVEAPMIAEPAGIRTARRAPVMAVVDADGDAIFRAE